MIPFRYEELQTLASACSKINHRDSMAIAGGTTMIDLMKLNVLMPESVVHVRNVLSSDVEIREDKLIIGAGCTMARLADHAFVKGKLPAVHQSLILAASPQISNMATLGGNLLQRTRSTYFRHTDMPVQHDSKQESERASSDTGSSERGSSERGDFGDGVETSLLAVLGNNGKLVGMYPSDFGVTFVAFGGEVVLSRPDGERVVAARDFYRVPRDSFQYTTILEPNEVIKELRLPLSGTLTNNLYLKIRERSSYAFALTSCSVGLQLSGDRISAAAVALAWRVTVVGHRAELTQPKRFPGAEVHCGVMHDVANELLAHGTHLSDGTDVVIMTHDFDRDVELMEVLLDSSVRSIGLLGPKRRLAQLVTRLYQRGRRLSDRDLDRIRSPLGLDIGAISPAEIATSIVAELIAITRQRDDGLLHARRQPIHPPSMHEQLDTLFAGIIEPEAVSS